VGALPQTRSSIKIQQIARYRVSGRLTDKQIAELVNMTPAGLAHLIKTPEYVDLEESLLSGRVSKMDEELAGDMEELRNNFRVAVPVAARTLLEVVQQRRDLRAAMSAASEILDRDPERTFIKAQKVTQASEQPTNGSFNPAAAGAFLSATTADGTKVAASLSFASGGFAGAKPTGTTGPREARGAGTPGAPGGVILQGNASVKEVPEQQVLFQQQDGSEDNTLGGA
jgi:hypothetical protein